MAFLREYMDQAGDPGRRFRIPRRIRKGFSRLKLGRVLRGAVGFVPGGSTISQALDLIGDPGKGPGKKAHPRMKAAGHKMAHAVHTAANQSFKSVARALQNARTPGPAEVLVAGRVGYQMRHDAFLQVGLVWGRFVNEIGDEVGLQVAGVDVGRALVKFVDVNQNLHA